MYCNACGTELPEVARYCHQCGTAAFAAAADTPPQPAHGRSRLSRPQSEKKIAGVCAGIARYLGVDVTLVRIILVCLALYPPCIGGIFYIVCWIVVPREPLLLGPANFNGGNIAVKPVS